MIRSTALRTISRGAFAQGRTVAGRRAGVNVAAVRAYSSDHHDDHGHNDHDHHDHHDDSTPPVELFDKKTSLFLGGAVLFIAASPLFKYYLDAYSSPLRS
ncbi:hypothetical protein BZA70DRAFT_295792 [Myxozyma melibiosi]|uniref:Uncharacterized protein n=1 Tax=Myxozyma melibiosi TaxID=54550 RepID=A0ABR1F470_9ASCO